MSGSLETAISPYPPQVISEFALIAHNAVIIFPGAYGQDRSSVLYFK